MILPMPTKRMDPSRGLPSQPARRPTSQGCWIEGAKGDIPMPPASGRGGGASGGEDARRSAVD